MVLAVERFHVWWLGSAVGRARRYVGPAERLIVERPQRDETGGCKNDGLILPAVVRYPTGRKPAADETQRANEDDPGFEGPEAYNDPEQRPLGERCLVGFSSTSGPPILPTYFYNNLHEIVQTPGQIVILTEMVHDARIIRMNEAHLPTGIRKWLGDSVGRWDGDTLVVDTTNFTDKTRFRGSSENLHVVERFTRVDARTLRYQFTIDDPTTWERSWTGEYAWPATDERVFEYACHEGNYAMGNILRGARLKEKDEAEKKSKPQP